MEITAGIQRKIDSLNCCGNIDNLLSDDQLINCDSRYRNIVGKIDEIINKLKENFEYCPVEDLRNLFVSVMQHIDKENKFMNLVGFPFSVYHCKHHMEISTLMADLCLSHEKHSDLNFDINVIRELWMDHIHLHDRIFETFLSE